jgi:hypothetical protein
VVPALPLTPVPGTIGWIAPGMAGIEISSGSSQVNKGVAKLKLDCGGRRTGACRGTLRLSTPVKRRSQKRQSVKTTVIAHGQYKLSVEKGKVVSVHLSRRALTLLARHHRLSVQAIATVSSGQGASRPIILHSARSPKHY